MMRDQREYRATLWNPQQAHAEFSRAWMHAKAMLLAQHRMQLSVRPQTRSGEQNSRLHATLADVADQVEWAGQKRDTNTWKRLMVSAWLRARGESAIVLPSVDGAGIDVIYEPTHTMTRSQVAELNDYIVAWGVMHGVVFHDPAAAPEPFGDSEYLRDESYRRRVAALPCANCGLIGHSQCAHANSAEFGKGMGIKSTDEACFPLCGPSEGLPGCHQLWDQGGLWPKEEAREKEREWIRWTKEQLEAAA